MATAEVVAMATNQQRTSIRRDSFITLGHPATSSRTAPMHPNHSGESVRVRTRTQAETPAPRTRPGTAADRGRPARTRPHTHRHAAAAISSELGFTVLARNSTIGDTATATPTTRSAGRRADAAAD